jgi:acetylornithine deacetylase/succinyl-diaminopimelate desuccinylase-like protein
MAHLDIVPTGDCGLWSSDPFVLKVDGDRMIGRGVEDNQQGACAGILALRAFLETGTLPAQDLGLVLAADEETGSAYGLEWLLENTDLFRAADQAIVPDAGDPSGDAIEVAEKSGIWYRFRVCGKQCHASRPAQGLNAHTVACRLVLELDQGLKRKFAADDVRPARVHLRVHEARGERAEREHHPRREDVFYLDARAARHPARAHRPRRGGDLPRGGEDGRRGRLRPRAPGGGRPAQTEVGRREALTAGIREARPAGATSASAAARWRLLRNRASRRRSTPRCSETAPARRVRAPVEPSCRREDLRAARLENL